MTDSRVANEMADAVGGLVADGEYATEIEVIRDRQRVLMARDRAVKNWLVQRVDPAKAPTAKP